MTGSPSTINFDRYKSRRKDEEPIEIFLDRLTPHLKSVADVAALLDWLTALNGNYYEDSWQSVSDEEGAWVFWTMPKWVAKYAEPLSEKGHAFSFGIAARCILQGKLREGYVESEKLCSQLKASGVNESTWIRYVKEALSGLDSMVAKVNDSESFAALCNYLRRIDAIRCVAGGYYAWYWQLLALNDLLRADAETDVNATLTTDAARWHWFGDLIAKAERATILGEIERFGEYGI